MRKRRRCRLRRCHRRTAPDGVLLCNVRTVDLRVRLVMRQRMVVRGLWGMVVLWPVSVVVGVGVVLHVSLLGDLIRGWQLDELWLEDWYQVLNAADVCQSSAQPKDFLLELVNGPAIERSDVIVFDGLEVGERRDERRCVVFFHNPIASGWLRSGFGWQRLGGERRELAE